MTSFTENIKKAAFEAVIGINVGGLLHFLKEAIMSLPSGEAWIAFIDISPIL